MKKKEGRKSDGKGRKFDWLRALLLIVPGSEEKAKGHLKSQKLGKAGEAFSCFSPVIFTAEEGLEKAVRFP